MSLYLLHEPAAQGQLREMLSDYQTMIKIVVDIRRKLLAGGGEMHYDGEQLLLEDGSAQDDLWGANWFPVDQRIEFESLINIRPRLGYRHMIIQDQSLRQAIERIARQYLGGVLP